MSDQTYIVEFDRLGRRGRHMVRVEVTDEIELEERLTSHALSNLPDYDDIEIDLRAGRVHSGADTSYGTFTVEQVAGSVVREETP
jgi:hypothetical protein